MIAELYQGDSFFTLGAGGRVGLVGISGLIAVVVAAASRALFARIPRALARAGAAVMVFWGVVWLSPQLYYLYYLAIFEDLALQWVIRMPSGAHILALLTFSAKPSLSDHSQGVLGWALILAALGWRFLPALRRPRSRH